MDPSPTLTTGYGADFARTLLALALVCGIAWWALRWAARQGLMTPRGGRVRVLERVALDAGRALYVVRVGRRVLLLGGGDRALALITELTDDDLPDEPSRPAEAAPSGPPPAAPDGSAGAALDARARGPS